MIRKLFSSPISPPCRAVKLVMEAIGQKEFKVEELNILTKQYLQSDLVKYNPQHTVPTLVDGDHILCDSHAIATYLVVKYNTPKSLYPKDIKIRSLIDQRLHYDSGVLYPTLCTIIKPMLLQNRKSTSTLHRAAFRKAYTNLNKILEDSNWLVGNRITLADLCLIPTISTMDFVVPIPENNFPKLKNYIQKCENEISLYAEINQTGIDLIAHALKGKTFANYIA